MYQHNMEQIKECIWIMGKTMKMNIVWLVKNHFDFCTAEILSDSGLGRLSYQV